MKLQGILKKRFVLLWFSIVMLTQIHAQPAAFQWGRQANHAFESHWDEGYGIAADTSGNEFVAGYFTDSVIVIGHDTLHNSVDVLYEDIFLAKYDSDGNAIWARKAGGTLSDWAISTCTDRNGNVFITGQFKSPIAVFGNDTLYNAGGMDFFIAKYDTNGNELWVRSSNGAYDDTGLDLGTDAAGNVYVSGYFSFFSVQFGSTTLYCSSNHTMFIVKYDTNGNVIWAENPIGGGNYGNVTKPFAVDQAGYSYVLGQIGTGTCLMKLDSAGNHVWTKGMPGASPDASVNADDFGNAYVTGAFYGASATFGSFTFINSSTANSGDMFLAKYDAAGNVPWARRTTGNSHEWGLDACTDREGNVFVTGTFYSGTVHFDSLVLSKTDSINANIFIAEYDSTGTVLAVDKPGKGNAPYTNAFGICNDLAGNAYMGGTYESDSIVFGPDLLLNPTVGGLHFFIAKWGQPDITTGISNRNIVNDIALYPNPTNGEFTLVFPSSENKNVTVEIYNSIGELIYAKRSFTNETERIDLSNHASGIYFIKVMSDNKMIAAKKIIKE